MPNTFGHTSQDEVSSEVCPLFSPSPHCRHTPTPPPYSTTSLPCQTPPTLSPHLPPITAGNVQASINCELPQNAEALHVLLVCSNVYHGTKPGDGGQAMQVNVPVRETTGLYHVGRCADLHLYHVE